MCEIHQLGYTPLIYAAMFGHLPVVEYLLEKGADLEAKNNVSHVIISCDSMHTSHMNILCVTCIRLETLHGYMQQ